MALSEDKINCCAVILSGGRNTRMAGRNKAFLKIGGKSILERIVETLNPVFKEILLVTRQPELYHGHALRVVEDILPSRCSLTGIHAGLVHASAPYAFVVPCDAPFLEPALVRSLLGQVRPFLDVIVPVCGDRYQPLCAIYSKRCIRPIEEQLLRNDFKIINFFDKINLKGIAVERLQPIDPGLRSFFNVNTPDAYTKSQKMDRQISAGPVKSC